MLINNATELLNYNKSEERKMEEMIEGIAATGVKAVFCQVLKETPKSRVISRVGFIEGQEIEL